MPFKRYDKSFKRDSCCFHCHSHSLVSISLLIDIEIEMSLPEFRIVNGLIFLFFFFAHLVIFTCKQMDWAQITDTLNSPLPKQTLKANKW